MGLMSLLRRRVGALTTPRSRLFELRELGQRRRSANQALIRSLAQPVYLGDGVLLARVLGRYKMFLDACDVGLSSHLALDGYWEMWLTEALAATVRPGMVVADIGANLGYFTLLMAELVGPTGHVHAFEPNPRLAALLRRSIAVNGFAAHVTVHERPLADSEASVRLLIPEGEPKNGWLRVAEPGEVGTHTTCRFDGLPELAEAAVVKIDADTSEVAILRGMQGVLDRGEPITIFLEFAAARYEDAGAFLDEIGTHGLTIEKLSLTDGIVAVSRAELLAPAQAGDDQMLVLRRAPLLIR